MSPFAMNKTWFQGFVFFWLSVFFKKKKNSGVLIYTTNTVLLPSFKIATINQDVLKDATSNFMCDFFNSSMITPISPLHRFPPSIHFILILAQLKKESYWPLTYSYWLTFLPF